jgi:hypothetical protein
MKGSKKATAQVGRRARCLQEEIGGEVNESEVCERERGESKGRDGMECNEVVSGGALVGAGVRRTGGGGRAASGLGRDGQQIGDRRGWEIGGSDIV